MSSVICKRLACVGGMSLLAAVLSAQGAPGSMVRIRFPENRKQVVVAQFMFRQPDGSYLQAGGSGGEINGSLLIPKPTDRPTRGLRARVWTPGCAIKVFDIPLTDGENEVQFVCDPVTTVPFRGRVIATQASGTIAAQYWGRCLTGGIEERQKRPCLFPSYVATAKLETDGSFRMDLPDFKADPVVSGDSSALFKFLLRKADGGWHLVKPEGAKDPSIMVSSSYPEDVTFVPAR